MNQLLFRLAAAGAALLLLPSGCGETSAAEEAHMEYSASDLTFTPVDRDTPIQAVMDNPLFGDYGRLLFPVESGWWSGETLEDLRLTFYSHIDPEATVAVINNLGTRAASGETVFYDIYTAEEKARDPAKADTGLFFFRGEAGAKTAICNAGGAFAYVGAMHDSFPHALALSQRGYNAFALIYRPGAQTACEDLARAIAFLHENAAALHIDMAGYSLWGG